MNPNENVQILRAGTVVENLTEVAVISQVLNDNGDSMLDRELGKLLEKYSRNLSKEQSKQVSELLLEFKNYLQFQIQTLAILIESNTK